MDSEKLALLAVHWPLVIQKIYPEIDSIPMGDSGSCESLLATWRGPYPAPSETQLADALDMVLDELPVEDPMPTLSDLQAQLTLIQAQINALIGGGE